MGKNRLAKQKPIEPKTTLEKVSVSKLATYVGCHRKYYWMYIRNIVHNSIYAPFFVGDIFHKGLAEFYDKVKSDDVIEHAKENIKKELAKFFIRPEDVGEVRKNEAIVLGMLKGYMRQYEGEPNKLKVTHTEQAFGFRLDNADVEFEGVIDMIHTEKGKKGEILVVDEHKTASKVTKDYIERLPFDQQVQCYPLFVERCLGKPLTKVVYNVTTKPQIRLKQSETFDQFIDRISDEYEMKPEQYFHREDLVFNRGHIEAAFRDVNLVAEEIRMYYECLTLEQLLNPESWYRNSRACFNYNSVCPYWKLCRYGDRPDIMSLYKEREAHDRGEKISEAE